MAAGATIKLKRKAGAFVGGELAAGELGLDVTNSDLYASVNGTTVFLFNSGLQDLVDDTTPTLGGTLDANNNRITNLPAPAAGNDPATKNYVDAALRGLAWQESVLNIQTDGTLNPGATPTEGDRYIITDTATAHANFTGQTGWGSVADDDIIQFISGAWVITFDASAEGEGTSVYEENANTQYVYNGTAWVVLGGSADHGGLTGLGDDDHTQYSLITVSASDPASTPARAGAIFVNTTSGRVWVAKGSSSSGDWQKMVGPDTTDTFTNKTISASTNTIDGGTI